jgi:hypothetical protein
MKHCIQPQTRKTSKVNWIGHILSRKCLLKHVIEGKIGIGIGRTGRQGRRRSIYWLTLRKQEDSGIWKRK